MSLIKIATLVKAMSDFDKRQNSTEEHLVVGRIDKKIALVSPYGEVTEISQPPITSSNNTLSGGLGREGSFVIPTPTGNMIIKWGRNTLPLNFNGIINFVEPFPTTCYIMLGSQQSNDPITSLMVNPISATQYSISFVGGNSNEDIAWIAIGN